MVLYIFKYILRRRVCKMFKKIGDVYEVKVIGNGVEKEKVAKLRKREKDRRDKLEKKKESGKE
jgi:hypothetical protein